MALQRSGTFTKSAGEISKIFKNLRNINLKPAKRIVIKFDPFNENVKQIRDFNHFILLKKVVKTNPLCAIRTDISCDRSESEVQIDLTTGQKLQLKCAHLTTLDILETINKYVTPLAPKEEEKPVVETKSKKKGRK